MSEENLTKDDLILLMDSYKNMISMHQTILEQTARVIESLTGISLKQESILGIQGNVCNNLSEIVRKLDDCIKRLKDSNEKIDLVRETVGDNVKSLSDSIKEKINNHNVKSIEDHGKIKDKIHLGWIGMSSIIISIIGLIVAMVYGYVHLLHLPH